MDREYREYPFFKERLLAVPLFTDALTHRKVKRNRPAHDHHAGTVALPLHFLQQRRSHDAEK